MDITSQSFAFHLPRILADLTTCFFVAIDLEFSGIARGQGDPAKSSQTLQDRYTETKKAADKYQILQIGLTICHEDIETATYTLKPYNLYLSPIIDRKLELERDFSFQSSAVEFLLGTRFRMDSVFSNGVFYLSREEEALVMSKALVRRDRSTVRDTLDVKETDHESLTFLTNARRLIDDWIALGNTREEFLNIPPPTRSDSKGSHSFPTELNRFQRRLVHQLIEVEYPSLVTISRQTFIQIVAYDENREKAVRDQRYRYTQERIWRQTGFRWIAEALAGGDLSNLDSSYFRPIGPGPRNGLDEFADRLKQQVKSNRPLLVGHNLFTDLVYFCRCFFGPLPDKVEDFQAMVHMLFPALVDTKYMATHDCGSINPTSSLMEINNSLAHVALPRIKVHPQHMKYNTEQIAHEAGYDSFLTAQVFIKLSSQLCGGTSKLPTSSHNHTVQHIPSVDHGQPTLTRAESSQATVLSTHESANRHWTQMPTGSHKPTNIGHRTRFDVLKVEDPADLPNTSTPQGQTMHATNHGGLVPRLESEFWGIYVNKLRVFGTEERVCVVGDDSK